MARRRNRNFTSKKANAVDILVFAVFMFIISIAVVVIYYAFSTFEPELTSDFQARDENNSVTILERTNSDYPSIFDGAIIFLFVGMWIVTLITSFFLDSHPIFFILSLFIFICLLFVVVVLQNTYVETMAASELLEFETTFSMTYWLMSHIYLTIIFVGITIIGALYAKTVVS